MKLYTQIQLYDGVNPRNFNGIYVSLTEDAGYDTYNQTFDVDYVVKEGDITYVVSAVTQEYDSYSKSGYDSNVVEVFDNRQDAAALAKLLDERKYYKYGEVEPTEVEYKGKQYSKPWVHWGTLLECIRADAVIVGMGRIY